MGLPHYEDTAVCSWSLQPKSIEDLIEKVLPLNTPAIQLALSPLVTSPSNWADTKEKLTRAGITIISGMFEPRGEDYSTPGTIRSTGGIIPDHTWATNWEHIQNLADCATQLGVPMVSFHCGFIPECTTDSSYRTIIKRVQMIADLFATKFAGSLLFETGQEQSLELLHFLQAVDRESVGINFDPANIILYNTGEPIEALTTLIGHVRQVHLKDALRPTVAGQWGEEVPLGKGHVRWQDFFEILKKSPFSGKLIIEREAGSERAKDIQQALSFIKPFLGHHE